MTSTIIDVCVYARLCNINMTSLSLLAGMTVHDAYYI